MAASDRNKVAATRDSSRYTWSRTTVRSTGVVHKTDVQRRFVYENPKIEFVHGFTLKFYSHPNPFSLVDDASRNKTLGEYRWLQVRIFVQFCVEHAQLRRTSRDAGLASGYACVHARVRRLQLRDRKSRGQRIPIGRHPFVRLDFLVVSAINPISYKLRNNNLPRA